MITLERIFSRRAYRIGAYVAGGVICAGLLYGLVAWVGARYVRSMLAERATNVGRSIEVGEVSVFWPGYVSIRDLRLIHPSGDNAKLPQIDIEYSVWGVLRGQLRPSLIVVKGGEVSLIKNSAADNFSDLLQPKGKTGDTQSRSGVLSEAVLRVSGLRITADIADANTHAKGKINALSIDLPVSGDATLVLSEATLQKNDEPPVASADSIQVKLHREKREIDLLGASIVHPEITLQRAHHLGLPLSPLLGLVRRSSPEEAPASLPNAPAQSRNEEALQRLVKRASSLEILDATLNLQDPENDTRISLQNVGVRFNTKTPTPDQLLLAFYASGGAPGKEAGWSAEGSFDLINKQLSANFNANQLSLQSFSPYMEGAKFVSPEAALLDFSVNLTYNLDRDIFVGGSFAASGLTIDHPKLASNPIQNFSFSVEGEVSYDFIGKALKLEKGKIIRDKAQIDLNLSLQKVEGGTLAKGRAKMPKTKCDELFASIPPDLIPSLEGFKLDGTFDFDLVLDLDTRKLKDMKLDGNLDLNRCRVLSAGPKVRVPLEDLRDGSFMQHVEEPDGKVYDFLVGKDSDDWTPLEEISIYLRNGILTTEDGAFFTHRGFITVQVIRSIVENIVAGGFKRGASTITMQFVKNVLLTREKTISRKLQEMVLTWWVEQNLPKERILTLYFNLIEFGPGIYGIHDAAEYYFESLPVDLTPWQAAYLLSIVPNPKKFHALFFEKKEVPAYWQERVRRILDRMHEKGRLTDEEWSASRAAPIVFGRTEEVPSSQPIEPEVP